MATATKKTAPANSYIADVKVTKTFAELVAAINGEGWIVSNCFQLGKNRFWRANLQFIGKEKESVKFFHEFADGWTAEAALTAALENARQTRNSWTRGKKSLSQEEIFGSRPDHHTGFVQLSLADQVADL
jgi:hypothetical protein